MTSREVERSNLETWDTTMNCLGETKPPAPATVTWFFFLKKENDDRIQSLKSIFFMFLERLPFFEHIFPSDAILAIWKVSLWGEKSYTIYILRRCRVIFRIVDLVKAANALVRSAFGNFCFESHLLWDRYCGRQPPVHLLLYGGEFQLSWKWYISYNFLAYCDSLWWHTICCWMAFLPLVITCRQTVWGKSEKINAQNCAM